MRPDRRTSIWCAEARATARRASWDCARGAEVEPEAPGGARDQEREHTEHESDEFRANRPAHGPGRRPSRMSIVHLAYNPRMARASFDVSFVVLALLTAVFPVLAGWLVKLYYHE
jgi:hypothetical protein